MMVCENGDEPRDRWSQLGVPVTAECNAHLRIVGPRLVSRRQTSYDVFLNI